MKTVDFSRVCPPGNMPFQRLYLFLVRKYINICNEGKAVSEYFHSLFTIIQKYPDMDALLTKHTKHMTATHQCYPNILHLQSDC